MVIKVYISGISGNKEVKKRQQRVLLILDSKNIEYLVIDIAEPGAEESKDIMQNKSTGKGATISDPDPRHPLPPQIFNEDEYCGDYDMFDMANEIDEMEKFLKLEIPEKEETTTAEIKLKNGDVTNDEKPEEEQDEAKENEVPNEQETNEESKENGAGDAPSVDNGNEGAANDEIVEDEEKPKSKEPSPAKSKESSPAKSKESSPVKSKESSPEKETEIKSKESSPEKADE